MNLFSVNDLNSTTLVLEKVLAVERDPECKGEEAVRVYLSGRESPLELFVEDPEKTQLEICAALSALKA
jgi:hypothetical protein